MAERSKAKFAITLSEGDIGDKAGRINFRRYTVLPDIGSTRLALRFEF